MLKYPDATNNRSGLAVEQRRILAVLVEHDGLSVSALSEKTFMAMLELSKTIDRMVFRALVHDRQDSADQRRVLSHKFNLYSELLNAYRPGQAGSDLFFPGLRWSYLYF